MESIPPSPFTKGTLKAELLSVVEEKKRKEAEAAAKAEQEFQDFVRDKLETCISAMEYLCSILKKAVASGAVKVELATAMGRLEISDGWRAYQISCLSTHHLFRYLVEQLQEEGFKVGIVKGLAYVNLSCLWKTDPPGKEPEPEN